MPVRPAPVAVLVSARSAGVGGQQSSRLGQTSSRKGKVAKGAAGKAVKKKSVASKKAKLPDDQMAKLATLAPAFAKAIESLPWMNDVVPAFSTALDNLPAGNKQQSARRVSFREPVDAFSPPAVDVPSGGVEGDEESSSGGSGSNGHAGAKQRERPAGLSPVMMAKMPSPPAAQADSARETVLLGDSLASRMAARRLAAREKRGAPTVGAQLPAAAAPKPTSLETELNKMRKEREQRVLKLFATLDQISQEGKSTMAPRAPLTTRTDIANPSTALVIAPSTALVPYQGVGVQANDTQTALLLSLLRGKESRKWLREWLAQDGRAEQVRAAIARAPEQLQQVIVGVLMRRLDDHEEEKDVRIMLLGGNALIEASKGGTNEDKPLPRPLSLTYKRPCSPPRIEVIDNVGSVLLETISEEEP